MPFQRGTLTLIAWLSLLKWCCLATALPDVRVTAEKRKATALFPTAATSYAKGDPHLQNMYGQRFDLMQPGKHTLLLIPKGAESRSSLLRVVAEAQRLGPECADIYFQNLNVTGTWAESKLKGGLHFHVDDASGNKPSWIGFGRGKVELKVVHGYAQHGTRYLNLLVRQIGHTGLPVGGLLGMDDHTQAATPPKECTRSVSI